MHNERSSGTSICVRYDFHDESIPIDAVELDHFEGTIVAALRKTVCRRSHRGLFETLDALSVELEMCVTVEGKVIESLSLARHAPWDVVRRAARTGDVELALARPLCGGGDPTICRWIADDR